MIVCLSHLADLVVRRDVEGCGQVALREGGERVTGLAERPGDEATDVPPCRRRDEQCEDAEEEHCLLQPGDLSREGVGVEVHGDVGVGEEIDVVRADVGESAIECGVADGFLYDGVGGGIEGHPEVLNQRELGSDGAARRRDIARGVAGDQVGEVRIELGDGGNQSVAGRLVAGGDGEGLFAHLLGEHALASGDVDGLGGGPVLFGEHSDGGVHLDEQLDVVLEDVDVGVVEDVVVIGLCRDDGGLYLERLPDVADGFELGRDERGGWSDAAFGVAVLQVCQVLLEFGGDGGEGLAGLLVSGGDGECRLAHVLRQHALPACEVHDNGVVLGRGEEGGHVDHVDDEDERQGGERERDLAAHAATNPSNYSHRCEVPSFVPRPYGAVPDENRVRLRRTMFGNTPGPFDPGRGDCIFLETVSRITLN